jgi:hypothetical protein
MEFIGEWERQKSDNWHGVKSLKEDEIKTLRAQWSYPISTLFSEIKWLKRETLKPESS